MGEWDGVSERRSAMIDLESRLNHMAQSLEDIKESQKCLRARLDSIERDINKVEGAWWVARYVIGPLVVLVPATVWALYEWVKDHVR